MKITLIVLGASMLGYMIPEFLAAIVKHPQPLVTNFWCAFAAAALAAGIAY